MLHSFAFNDVDDITLEVYNFIFGDEVNLKYIDYAYEIIEAALAGKLDFTRSFNIRAYVKRIQEMNNISTHRENKRKVVIIDSDEEYEESGGGVFSSSLSDGTDAYEEYLDKAELDYIMGKGFKLLYRKVAKQYKCDLVVLIERALGGVKECIETLNFICESNEEIGYAVTTMLSCGIPFDELIEKYGIGGTN